MPRVGGLDCTGTWTWAEGEQPDPRAPVTEGRPALPLLPSLCSPVSVPTCAHLCPPVSVCACCACCACLTQWACCIPLRLCGPHSQKQHQLTPLPAPSGSFSLPLLARWAAHAGRLPPGSVVSRLTAALDKGLAQSCFVQPTKGHFYGTLGAGPWAGPHWGGLSPSLAPGSWATGRPALGRPWPIPGTSWRNLSSALAGPRRLGTHLLRASQALRPAIGVFFLCSGLALPTGGRRPAPGCGAQSPLPP